MNPAKIINGMPYANACRNSSLPVSLSLSGKKVWTVSAPANKDLGFARMLTISGATLLICCQRGVYAIDTSNGKLLWVKDLINYAEPFISNGHIRSVSSNHFLEYVDLNGVSTERFLLPILVHTFVLFHVTISDDRIFLFLNRHTSQFDDPEPEGFLLIRYIREKNDIKWHYEHEDLATGFAHVPESGQLFVATYKQLFKTTIDAKKDRDLKKFGITGTRSLSMDHHGNLLIMREDGRREMLLCTDGDGKKKWEAALSEFDRIVHPSACSKDNVVYCSPGKILCCIEKGNLLWQKPVSALDEHGLMLTVLDDSSVIAAGADIINHFSRTGAPLVHMRAPFEITCRPVADEKGRLFVAGWEGVNCYR